MSNTTLVTRRPAARARGLRPVLGLDRKGFDRLFDELWRSLAAAPVSEHGAWARGFAPRLDVEETDEAIRVFAELPGLDEKDFEVSLEGDVLSIRGERRDARQDAREGYRHVETPRGSFHRSVRLPFEVDPEKVEATYRRGVLEISLPRPEEARPRVRQIPVQSA